MVINIIFLVIGIALVARPDFFVRTISHRHEQRSTEIDAGAQEDFFEERRMLAAYPNPPKPWFFRLLGGLLAGISLFGLIVDLG